MRVRRALRAGVLASIATTTSVVIGRRGSASIRQRFEHETLV
jgi:hypothetical protein